MKAGRELDAEIAEKIMDWGHVLDPLGTLTGQPLPKELPEHWTSGIPHYSTDISAAWQVIERMREQGWWYTLTDERFNGHFAEFRRADEHGIHHFHRVIAGTAPLAICKAALACVDTDGYTWSST